MKSTLIMVLVLFLSGCSWIPWFSSSDEIKPTNLLTLSLKRSDTVESTTPLTIIIMQPAEQKSFVAANYSTVIQQSLDKGVKRYVMLANEKEDTIVLPVTQTPLAIYFIMEHQPTSNWKYYIAEPQGENQLFTINQDSVSQETQDGLIKGTQDE